MPRINKAQKRAVEKGKRSAHRQLLRQADNTYPQAERAAAAGTRPSRGGGRELRILDGINLDAIAAYPYADLCIVVRPAVQALLHDTTALENERRMDQVLDMQENLVTLVLQRLLSEQNPSYVPQREQINVVQRLVFSGADTILIAATGFGKSLVFQAVSLMNGLITLQIVPLTILAEQQFMDTQRIPDANPCIITAESKATDHHLFQRIESGEYSHVLMGPEQLLSPEFKALLAKPSFGMRIGMIAIDEAHCMSDWSSFRSEYSQIHTIRSLLPRDACVFACTGTMNIKTEARIIKYGGFDQRSGWNTHEGIIRTSIDRPEIAIVAIKLPATNQMDALLFLLSKCKDSQMNRPTPSHIEKTIVFADSLKEIDAICGFLRAYLISEGYTKEKAQRTIRVYTAQTAKADQEAYIEEFSKSDARSKIRIVIATTALSLGVNILGLPRIVQFKPPIGYKDGSVECNLWQRFGRGGRGYSRCIAYLLLQPRFFGLQARARMPRRPAGASTQILDSRPHNGSEYSRVGTPIPETRSRVATPIRNAQGQHVRRNAEGVDPSGRDLPYMDLIDEGIVISTEDAIHTDTESEDGDEAAREMRDNQVKTTDSTFLSDLVQMKVDRWCLRRAFLIVLGEEHCPEAERKPPAPPGACCSGCNPGLIPDHIAFRRPPVISKPALNSKAFFIWDCIHRWLQGQAQLRVQRENLDINVPAWRIMDTSIQYRLCRTLLVQVKPHDDNTLAWAIDKQSGEPMRDQVLREWNVDEAMRGGLIEHLEAKSPDILQAIASSKRSRVPGQSRQPTAIEATPPIGYGRARNEGRDYTDPTRDMARQAHIHRNSATVGPQAFLPSSLSQSQTSQSQPIPSALAQLQFIQAMGIEASVSRPFQDTLSQGVDPVAEGPSQTLGSSILPLRERAASSSPPPSVCSSVQEHSTVPEAVEPIRPHYAGLPKAGSKKAAKKAVKKTAKKVVGPVHPDRAALSKKVATGPARPRRPIPPKKAARPVPEDHRIPIEEEVGPVRTRRQVRLEEERAALHPGIVRRKGQLEKRARADSIPAVAPQGVKRLRRQRD
jgi:superfamily II DNA helicase RecQ